MKRIVAEEEGQAIVVIAIVFLAMVMTVGLAVDTGQLYNGRRNAQEAADAAAFAGAVVLYQSGTASSAKTAAANDAYMNGFCQRSSSLAPAGCTADQPTSGTTVTVSSPPSAGSYSGNASCVQVQISDPVQTTLMQQVRSLTTVIATGTACTIAAKSKFAVIALDKGNTKDALYVGPQGTLAVTGGGLQVNSSNSQGADNKGTVTLQSHTPAYQTDVSGTGTGGTFPNTQTGQPQQSDPLAGAPLPPAGSSQTLACSPTINQPGAYNGQSTTNCDYAFAPGTYVFEGGSFNLAGNSSMCTGATVNTTAVGIVSAGTQTITPLSMTNITALKTLIVDTGSSQEVIAPTSVTATTFTAVFQKSHSATWSVTGGCPTATSTADGGVFFFFTNLNYPTETGGCASPQMTGNDATTLSPPTSGTYQGMLIWIDSGCGSSVSLTIGGNGSIDTTGTIYVPSGTVQGHGNNAVVNASQIVAQDVSEQNASFTVNYSSSSAYQGPVPSLVE